MNLPTSFVLPDEAVDRLRSEGGKLLRESNTYQDLIRELHGTIPPAPQP
jgi:NTE family protein